MSTSAYSSMRSTTSTTTGGENNRLLRLIGSNYMSYTLGLVIVALMIIGGLVFLADLGVDIATLVYTQDVKDTVHGLKGHVRDVCDDGNPCTQDRVINGGCVSRPSPNGTPCETSCYKPETDPATTAVCTIPSDCKDCAECVGTECAGVCELDADCPVLPSSQVALGNASNVCTQSSCVSSLDVAGLYPDLDVECSSEAALFVKACEALLEPTTAVVADSCIVSYPVCVNGTLSSCVYYFECAPVQPTIIV